MAITMRLEKHIQITGKIICLTGLTIGTGDVFGIGGVDKEMIRTGREDAPYIPGSSLKGKMRHLFELVNGGGPMKKTPHSCGDPKCAICRIFGAGDNEQEVSGRGPTRLIVRDAYIDTETPTAQEYKRRAGSYTEVKAENVINRLDGQATPRRFERVPKGLRFSLEVVYRQFEVKDDGTGICGLAEAEADIGSILDALSYVHRDYLGASGSRGYGKVEFQLDLTNDEIVNAWIEAKIGGCPGVSWS